MQAKVDPYLRPLHDAPRTHARRRMQKRWKRGRSRLRRWRTCAAARSPTRSSTSTSPQNATAAQMKFPATCVNSKTMITGDKTQIDLPKREESGLMQTSASSPASTGSRFTISTRRT
jgi:phosphate starvation-inducible PhoH-like protein